MPLRRNPTGDVLQEIPWNLFSPKAPYQGKVIENDFHPQTLTQPTGDANWETTHVTFDHGGKVPYIEGQSIGVIAPGPDKKGDSDRSLCFSYRRRRVFLIFWLLSLVKVGLLEHSLFQIINY